MGFKLVFLHSLSKKHSSFPREKRKGTQTREGRRSANRMGKDSGPHLCGKREKGKNRTSGSSQKQSVYVNGKNSFHRAKPKKEKASLVSETFWKGGKKKNGTSFKNTGGGGKE